MCTGKGSLLFQGSLNSPVRVSGSTSVKWPKQSVHIVAPSSISWDWAVVNSFSPTNFVTRHSIEISVPKSMSEHNDSVIVIIWNTILIITPIKIW